MKTLLAATAAAALLLTTVAVPPASAHWVIAHHRLVWVPSVHRYAHYWHPTQRYWNKNYWRDYR